MIIRHKSVCFATLAYGIQFRLHAKILAQDLLTWHPGAEFIVVTDCPEYFHAFPNVRAIKYIPSGIRHCYHDKRQVIREAINLHNACVYLDADCRIPAPINYKELFQEGVFFTAIYGENLQQKLSGEIESGVGVHKPSGPVRRKKILSNIALHENIDFDNITFINETCFVVNSEFGDVHAFLNTWDYCAVYTTFRLFEFGEGASIGIALEKIGAKPHLFQRCPPWLFKDGYRDTKTKTAEQLVVFQRLLALRRAIECDAWPRKSKIAKMIEVVGAALRFYFKYLKNSR